MSGIETAVSVRDFFAAHAMAILEDSTWVSDEDKKSGRTWNSILAKDAYELADAMLAERAKDRK